jgi:hypothetical protein
MLQVEQKDVALASDDDRIAIVVLKDKHSSLVRPASVLSSPPCNFPKRGAQIRSRPAR